MGCCKKTIYNLIEELKDLGAEIKYNVHINSFEYVEAFELKLIINGRNIIGGKNNFMSVRLLHSKQFLLLNYSF